MNRKRSLGVACSVAYPVDNVSSVYKSDKGFAPPSTVQATDFISVGFKTASGIGIQVSGASLGRIQKLNLLTDPCSRELVDSPLTENQMFENASGFKPNKHFVSPLNKAQCDTGSSSSTIKTTVSKNVEGFPSTKSFVSPWNKTQFDSGSLNASRKTSVSKSIKGFKSPLLNNAHKSLGVPEARVKFSPKHFLPKKTFSSSNEKVETSKFEKAECNTSELLNANSHIQKLNPLNDQMTSGQVDSLFTESKAFSNASGCPLTKSFAAPEIHYGTESSSTLRNTDISQNVPGFCHKYSKSPLFCNLQKSLDVTEKSMEAGHFRSKNTSNAINNDVETANFQKAEADMRVFDAEAIMKESEQFFDSLPLDDPFEEPSIAGSPCVCNASSICTKHLHSSSIHEIPSTTRIAELALVGFKTASGSGIKVSSASLHRIQTMNLLSDQSTSKLLDPRKTPQSKPFHSAEVNSPSQSPVNEAGSSDVLNCSKTVQIRDYKKIGFKSEITCKGTKISDSVDPDMSPNTAAVFSKSSNLMPKRVDFSSTELYNNHILNNKYTVKCSSTNKLDCTLQCNYYVGKKCSKPSSTSKLVSPSHLLVRPEVLNCSVLFDAKSHNPESSRDGRPKINAGALIHKKHLSKSNSTFLEAICGFCDIIRYSDQIEQLEVVHHSVRNLCNLCISSHTDIELVTPSADNFISIKQILGRVETYIDPVYHQH